MAERRRRRSFGSQFTAGVGCRRPKPSDLPVYQVHVEFVPISRWQGQSAVVMEVVPPGDWVVSGRLVYPATEPARSRPDLRDLPDRTFVIELRFADSNGRVWRRSKGGVLTPES